MIGRKNILLIGGTGFVGSYLARKLLKEPAVNLSVIHASALAEKPFPSVSYHQMDLTQENGQLRDITNRADTIMILTQPNELIIQNIIAAIRDSATPKKIVYLSTLLLYPDSENPQKEETLPEPISIYEEKKFLEEKLLAGFVNGKHIVLSIVRLANVYGDVKNNGVIAQIFQSLMEGKTLIINGQGNQKRDYIFLEDAAELLECFIFHEQKVSIEVFNICTGIAYTVNELIEKIEKVTKQKVSYSNGPAVLEKQIIIGDNSKILNLSEYRLKYDLAKGLKKTYTNFLSAYNYA